MEIECHFVSMNTDAFQVKVLLASLQSKTFMCTHLDRVVHGCSFPNSPVVKIPYSMHTHLSFER